MSYKLNEQRITPGGLDLLVPSDQNPRKASLTDLVGVPQGECLDLTDWWPGADGHLEQTLQATQLQPSSANITSLCETAGRKYYGSGFSLYQIGRGTVSATFDGNPLGLIAFQGFLWAMNQGAQIRDDGTTVSPWTPAAPTLQPVLVDLGTAHLGGDGNPDGAKLHLYEDSYVFTWVYAGLGETNPSPAALLTPAVDLSSTSIAANPSTAPAGVTGFNIYRQVPAYGGASLDGNSAYYLVNTTGPVPVGTVFVDTGNFIEQLDDTSILLVGVLLQGDHDPAPPAMVVANQTFNGRILVANSVAHPNRVWWTDAEAPAFFPGAADAYDGNWVDVGTDDGDAILAITIRPGMAVFYRQKSVWVNIGDMGDPAAVLQPVCQEVGIAGVRAVVSTAAGDYFVGNTGEALYAFNNDWPSKLSMKVDPIFRDLPTENFIGGGGGRGSYSEWAVGHRQGRLWVSFSDNAASDVTLILHLASGRWFANSSHYRVFLDVGSAFWGANYSGVYELEAAYTGSSTNLAFQSQYHDCGLPDREKTWADLVFTHNTRGQTLTITCRTNKFQDAVNDTFVLGTFTSPGPGSIKEIFPLVYPMTYTVTALQGKPIKAFSLSIRITGNGASAAGLPIVIDSPILLHYYLEARQGLTFDSGNTNHGLTGVGTIDQIEIDCDLSGGVAKLMISSDIPGGVMADRTSGGYSIPQTTGRQVVRLIIEPESLGTSIVGRLFRHQMSSAFPFQVYGYKVRILPIGVYCDGSQLDFWYTLPIAPGEDK